MKRPPRKIPTPKSLGNIALHYLGRFAASEASLRRVLTNRIKRVALESPAFSADFDAQTLLRSAIETIIETHKRTGVIDDAALAELKVNSLRRQGRSRNAIQQRLAIKGIRGHLVNAALDQNAEGAEPEEIELKAALVLAKKRKLGAFRQKPADDARKRKDFATMARAGFSSRIARKALDARLGEDDASS